MGDLAKSRASQKLRGAIETRKEQDGADAADVSTTELVDEFSKHVEDPTVFENVADGLLE